MDRDKKFPTIHGSYELHWAEFCYRLAYDTGKLELARDLATEIAKYHQLYGDFRVRQLTNMIEESKSKQEE